MGCPGEKNASPRRSITPCCPRTDKGRGRNKMFCCLHHGRSTFLSTCILWLHRPSHGHQPAGILQDKCMSREQRQCPYRKQRFVDKILNYTNHSDDVGTLVLCFSSIIYSFPHHQLHHHLHHHHSRLDILLFVRWRPGANVASRPWMVTLSDLAIVWNSSLTNCPNTCAISAATTNEVSRLGREG